MPSYNSSIVTGNISGAAVAIGQAASATVNILYTHARPAPVSAGELAAAQQLLASLPLDTLPDLKPLPPGSRLMFARNPLFTGRTGELGYLAHALKGANTIASIGQVAAATGLGGIGKTQLAVEFVHHYGCYFAGGVFWVNLTSDRDAKEEIAKCGGAEGLQLRADFDTLELDERVALVLSEWQNPLPRLLVFDNCESETLLQRWRPPTGGSRILVTSRKAEWDLTLGVHTLALGLLTRAESLELLQKFRPDLQSSEELSTLNNIAAELGDLPLALHLAGSYLRRFKVPPPRLLADLRRPDLLSHPSLIGLGLKINPTSHENHVARTFAISYRRLIREDETDRLALNALARSACFAPGVPIPPDLLKQTLDEPQRDWLAEEALHRLAELGLLTPEENGAFTLHRLLANFVQRTNPDLQAFESVARLVYQESRIANATETPVPLRSWAAHLRYVAETALGHELDLSGELFRELAYYLEMEGNFTDAYSVLQQAVAVFEQQFDPEHPNLAAVLNDLGVVYQDLGNYLEARQAHERALRILEKHFGAEHPSLAAVHNSLGEVSRVMGDYPGALAAFEHALRIDEIALGPDHPKIAIRVNNLGSVLHDMGDYVGAQTAYKRALQIDEAAYGKDHPHVASALNNLGEALRETGHYAEAQSAFQRALAIWEPQLGAQHPYVGMAANNLGLVLQGTSKPVAAQAAFERALAIFEHELGPEHPTIATVANNLGLALQNSGDFDRAQAAYQRALQIDEALFGPLHPNVARDVNNLGGLAYSKKDYAEAQKFFERALHIYEQTLDANHPSIRLTRQNLAAVRPPAPSLSQWFKSFFTNPR